MYRRAYIYATHTKEDTRTRVEYRSQHARKYRSGYIETHFATARSDESPARLIAIWLPWGSEGERDGDMGRKQKAKERNDPRALLKKTRARAPPTARGKHAVYVAIKLIGMTSLLLRVGRLSLCAPERVSHSKWGNKF